MEQVEDQVHLTVKEVTPLLDQVTQSIADDLLPDSMKLNEYSTRLLLPTQTYATIGSGIVIWDANNHLIDANEAARRILGMNFYELQQHLTTHPGGVFLRTDGSPLSIEKQCSTIAWQTGIAQYNILEGFLRSDGKCCWLQVDALPVKDMEGAVIGVVANFMDVTTHVAAIQHVQQEDRISGECERLEAALYISEKRFQTVVASVPVILNTFDRSGIITLSIGGGLESLGLVPGESVGHSVFELYSAYPAMLNNVRRALAGEAFASVHHVKERVFNTRFTPILNQHNKVDSLVSIAVDITEREKAEESLHQNGQIYQALSEQATDLVFITSAAGTGCIQPDFEKPGNIS